MAAMLKKIFSVSKSNSMPRYAFPRFSTAYERAEGSNAVAEAEGSNGDGMYETRQEDLGMSKDPARDGPIKAVNDADMVRGTAKESMDGAWKASQEGSHKEVNKQEHTNEDM